MEEQTIKNASDTSPSSCNRESGKEKRRTSILKPPKLRTPLKELQFTSSQEVKGDATARPSRRVSFGHFHVRKFGYENGAVCDSIYSFDSSKSESSMQANNSIGENGVSAFSSSHHCKNISSENTDSKKDSHMILCQDNTKHKGAEIVNKITDTDIGFCSQKKVAVKQILDDSPGFSAIDRLSRRHSSESSNSKSYVVRTEHKDNDYFERESFVGRNSVVLDAMQRLHEQGDMKQLQCIAKHGREQREEESQAEARNCEQHLYSATVADMELADSYSYGHIECKEVSMLQTKRKKSINTTAKSFRFAAESDMELTKVIDTFCCREVLSTAAEKSIALNNAEAKNNFMGSGDCEIAKNSKDYSSMQNVSQQLNATKRFSTNNGMDITEGCGIIDCISDSDVPNDDTAGVVNSDVLSLSRLSMDKEDSARNEEKASKYSAKYSNPSEFSEKLFINESMEQTLAVGCVLNESCMDYRKAVKGFQMNENVSCSEYSCDNILPIIGEKCCNVTAAVTPANKDKLPDTLEKCTKTKPNDTNNFNASKTIIMCVDMESTQDICQNDQDDSFMQFTRVVEANIQDSSMQDHQVSLENKHCNHTKHVNTEKKTVTCMEKSTLKCDIHSTHTGSPLCDNRSVREVVATERQTDICVTATSSSKVSPCKDQKNESARSHILDTKPNHSVNEAVKFLSSHTECNIQADVFTDTSAPVLPEKTTHERSCKQRFSEGADNTSTKQAEHNGDRSVKCQTAAKKMKIHTVSSMSPEFKTEAIQQGNKTDDVENSVCRVLSNSSITQDAIEFCVMPISDTKNIPNKRENANKILSKYSEHQPYCSDGSDLRYSPSLAVEDCLVTGNEPLCASESGMLNKKRRSSEMEETRGVTKSQKKQCVTTDHINDKQCSQNATEHSDLPVETKAFCDRDAVVALCVEPGVVNTASSGRNSPLPENEVLIRNVNYGDVIERSNTYDQNRDTEKYTGDSIKTSNTAGTPSNTSELKVPHMSVRKDKNPQHSEDSGSCIDDDKNNVLSASDSNDKTGVTLRRGRRYESNTVSLSFMDKSIKNGEYCIEMDKSKHKSVVKSNAELKRDVNSENNLSCSLSNSKQQEKTASLSQSRYDDSHTSVKEGDDQISEGIRCSPGNNCSFHGADAAIHKADKTFHSWYRDRMDAIVNKNCSASADKIDCNNSCQKTFGTIKCFPAQDPDVASKAARLDDLSSRSEEIGQNVTGDSSQMDFRMSDRYLNTEINLPEARERITVVKNNTSNYLINNREQDALTEFYLVSSCYSKCLKPSVQENKNSNSGKEMDNQQFIDNNNSVDRSDVNVMQNVTSEVNKSQDPEEKHHADSNFREVSLPCETLEVIVSCEANGSCSNIQSQPIQNVVQGSCSVTNTAQDFLPVVQSTEQHKPSVDRALNVPSVTLSVGDCAAAACGALVCPAVQCITECSQSAKTARDFTSTRESAKIRLTIDGEVGDAGIASTFCTKSQTSKGDSFNNETAVHSETLYSTAVKMRSKTEKQEVIVLGIQEEKLTSPAKNKCKKIENLIISKAERSEVVWNIRALTQFQWIFTFLNDTLRLYINFNKCNEDGIVEDLDFISYLTGKADEDAKFVHFVLLKKFSKNKLKALCKDIEEIPELLEKISVDVHQMVAFLYEFQKVHLLYNMEMFGTSVSFNVMSYKLAICFKLNIDLCNWEQILEDSITITQKYGHVNETQVKNLANGVERNSYFLQNYYKAVKQYMKILERFGC
ncbi:uncharacterized protein LOC126268236 isoform X1 [Schistocerca gregaria]|uniref:uncharacterized protein LOC126268236 isoform X1 n=1 Tax=Schistocerca gregaria TaxID=7010 RepID=UPI00211E1343|nr:uncharacterized protein LOC126268236 isoform X1 [Schistocerca gregaria]